MRNFFVVFAFLLPISGLFPSPVPIFLAFFFLSVLGFFRIHQFWKKKFIEWIQKINISSSLKELLSTHPLSLPPIKIKQPRFF